MNSIILCAVHLVALCLINIPYTDALNRTRRVAHGVDAQWGMFPFMALIKGRGGNNAGSIISQRYILTVTGIVYKNEKHLSKVIVRTIDTDGTNGIKYDIEDVVDYPYFHAVCLLRVNRNIAFSPLVHPIRLSSSPNVCEGCPALLAGWAHLPNKHTKKLQMGQMYVARMDRCIKTWSKVKEHPERYVCGEVDNNLPKACCGDPAAPLVVGGELVGLIYFSIKDDLPGYPDVYFRVSYFRNWIHQNMRH